MADVYLGPLVPHSSRGQEAIYIRPTCRSLFFKGDRRIMHTRLSLTCTGHCLNNSNNSKPYSHFVRRFSEGLYLSARSFLLHTHNLTLTKLTRMDFNYVSPFYFFSFCSGLLYILLKQCCNSIVVSNSLRINSKCQNPL